MKSKRIVGLISLAIILIVGIYTVVYTFNNVPITYDGSDTDVTQLYNDPNSYNETDPDGIADIIVGTNLRDTMAVNNVAAVVFDFRGFDTIGEAFILITAIAGAFVILSKSHKSDKGGKH